MVLFFGLTMVTIPAQTNGLNALPRELYADGSAAIAIAITLFTAGQTSFAQGTREVAQGEVIAAGIKYAFYFIVFRREYSHLKEREGRSPGVGGR